MRVSRNQRHRALCSLLLSSVGRNFSSSKTKEQWLQEREGEFSSPKGPLLLYATAPTFPKAGVALPPLDRMSSLCRRAGGWQQQRHAPQPGCSHGQQRYLLSSALLAISSAVMLARAAAGTRSASYSAGDRTGRMLRKRTSLGSPFQLGQFCPRSLEETWAGQGDGTWPGTKASNRLWHNHSSLLQGRPHQHSLWNAAHQEAEHPALHRKEAGYGTCRPQNLKAALPCSQLLPCEGQRLDLLPHARWLHQDLKA